MMDERLDQMPADARDDALAYGREREQERLECWRAQIGDSDAVMYLRTRGVSLDTARKWGLGYDRERKRLVIPYVGSEYFHVDRDITGGAEEKYTVPSTDELGSLPLYNPSAFDSPAFYVVEGPLDALAILDEGKPAVALCGTNYEEVVAASVSRGYRGTIIAALDSDAEGRKAQERFMLALKQSGLYGVEFSYHRGAKDAAEARCIEPVQFSVDIARAYEKAVQTRRETCACRGRATCCAGSASTRIRCTRCPRGSASSISGSEAGSCRACTSSALRRRLARRACACRSRTR